ncbi:PEP-CTERM sorting domain-containing protein [Janthinobacterium sp.]|uniref:PEP-CTERM sorting domain-containing protein n=1 Tax=Janthinobacterium sp. TaxID=1871054 RepID=UPI002DB5F78B|nr:PEP-CTERM sorting domain-containing protein [Janthinobacterium sp.]HEU4819062.1 PEP-CTERM sorting domain-containing protein [Janthinobacterium sp.]
MGIYQPLCVALLALSASTGSVAAVSDTTAGKLQEAGERVTIDESISLNNNPGWETPDLPYARLLASSATAAPHWSTNGARHAALAPPKPMTAAPAQQASVPAPVPEASMYSMLLVGLGLVALSLHGEKQEKFDN